MKKALKKVLAVVSAAAMALGLMTMSATAAFADEADYSLTVKINFTKPADWSTVYAKVCGDANANEDWWGIQVDGYDGVSDTAALTGSGDVYSLTVTAPNANGLHIIFNNGGWDNGQTQNLNLADNFAAGSYEYNLTCDQVNTLSDNGNNSLTADDLAPYLASSTDTPDSDTPDATVTPAEDNSDPEATIAADDEETPATEDAEEAPAADQPDETPKTGDNALIFVAAGLALVAGTSAVVIKKRKAA